MSELFRGPKTTRAYHVEPLQPGDVDRAFLVVATVARTLSLEEWKRFCAAIDDKPWGGQRRVWIAKTEAGIVRGVAVGRLEKHDVFGTILDIPLFTTASAADDRGVARALIDYLSCLARAATCRSIRFWTILGDNWERMAVSEEIGRSDIGVQLLV
ncbi:hypothetical protein [Rhizobium sp. BK376]|jgi:hypothetical protein|uniref:hypothetical protein n=1 Tax=Rhizobium sp. BK376 TaxID=2512149 RepID=UPI0010430FAD|nr:hypothetical protein [Rhizobium sp. BK376]TCR75636.1 hypothetical protein EV561_12275 [Rhizobium sp. BK376]